MTITNHEHKTIHSGGKSKLGTYFLYGCLGIAILGIAVLYFDLSGKVDNYLAATTTPAEATVLGSAYCGVTEAYKVYAQKKTTEEYFRYGRALDTLYDCAWDQREELRLKFFHVLAQEVGVEYNIHWSYLYGLWLQESRLDSSAKGDGRRDSVGVFIPGTWRAFGLGQVHLATARAHYDSSITRAQLMNPVINARVSAKVLRDYTDLFGHDILYGIAAYQQGPTVTKSQFKTGIPPKNWAYLREVLKFRDQAMKTWPN